MVNSDIYINWRIKMKVNISMFKKGVLGVALLAFTISAKATLITFDEFGLVNDGAGNGEVTGNEWAASGVQFSTSGIALNLGNTTGSQPNSLGADAVSTNDFDGNLTIQFLNGISYTDVFFTIFNTPFQASAYASDDTLLNTLTSGPDFTQLFDFTGYAVNRIEITGSFYAIDDLSFTTSASVPEPAILSLLALGLAGIGFSRKRKVN